MNASTQTGQPTDCLNLVIRWLGGRDKEKIEKATSILVGIGHMVVKYLVQAAMQSGRRSDHRGRILDVIQRIGGPLGPDEMFGLQSLLGCRNPKVRQKAEEVIMSMSPGGPPKTPEAAAVMRIFNPFLTALPRGRPRRTRLSDFEAALRGDRAAARRYTKSNVTWQKREERELEKDSFTGPATR